MTNQLFACGVALALAASGAASAKKPTSADKKENKAELGLKGKGVAKAELEAKSGSKLKGKVTFTDDGKNGIVMRIDVSDAPPGIHAVHIHDKGDCSSPDGKSAGDHWNPMHEPHGKWGAEANHYHLGDIGNLEVKPDGKGTLTLETTKWSAGGGAMNDVIGHAVIVHGGVDDFTTQPTGNAGPRIGCGVIVGDGVKEKGHKAAGSDPEPKAGTTPEGAPNKAPK
jgi:Cu-Zn family superoxide dismutase